MRQAHPSEEPAEVGQFGGVAGIGLGGQRLGQLRAGRFVVERQRGQDDGAVPVHVEMIRQRQPVPQDRRRQCPAPARRAREQLFARRVEQMQFHRGLVVRQRRRIFAGQLVQSAEEEFGGRVGPLNL